jgi:tRNA A-37 threonylcarbamoyl transferase component Bud32
MRVFHYKNYYIERDGGLDLHTMMRARESLRALHALGVLHNDVELRNVVKREGGDDAVLWVDFELARIRKPEDDDAG